MKIMKLSGPPGSGKTTALSALKRDYLARGWVVRDFSGNAFAALKAGIEKALQEDLRVLVLVDEPSDEVRKWLHLGSATQISDQATLIYTSET